jgi:hypothetical protein
MGRKMVAFAGIGIVAATLAGCGTPASTTSDNLSKAADNFEVNRRITFVNGITDKQLMIIEGRCSIAPDTGAKKLDVTCKIGPDQYKKHFLGLSDNVFYFVEQIDANNVDPNHYRVFWRPEILIPNIDHP